MEEVKLVETLDKTREKRYPMKIDVSSLTHFKDQRLYRHEFGGRACFVYAIVDDAVDTQQVHSLNIDIRAAFRLLSSVA